EARPAMPAEGSMNPEATRLRRGTFRLAATGVIAASVWFIGPSLPFSLISPPPPTYADSENGKTLVAEKSCSSALTFSSVWGFARLFTFASDRRPSLILIRLMERSRPVLPEAGAGVGFVGCFVPKLEKFHSPAAV